MDSNAWYVHAIWALGGERHETYGAWVTCQGQPQGAKLAPGNEFLVMVS
jgi:hypothetical protein